MIHLRQLGQRTAGKWNGYSQIGCGNGCGEMAAEKWLRRNGCDNAAGETAAGKGCRANTENGCTGHIMAAADPRCSDSGGAVEIAAAKMGLQTCQWNKQIKARNGYGRNGQNNTAIETHLQEMAAEQALKMAAMDFKKMAAANPRCSEGGGAVEIAAAKMGLQTCQWNNCRDMKWPQSNRPLKRPPQIKARNGCDNKAGNGCRASTEHGCTGNESDCSKSKVQWKWGCRKDRRQRAAWAW